MNATWTKLKSGEWGVRVAGAEVKAGETIVVTKKSGETKTVKIARVLWTGDGISLCAVGNLPSAIESIPPVGRACVSCGERERLDSRGYAVVKIYRSGECQDCYEERKNGY